ncbi:hypothetical protein MPER_10855 [Moniliophthora perniciosa FA553]|nr:hypothetical protein MPER_10855 [Moniliophthora perniciosa FA553]
MRVEYKARILAPAAIAICDVSDVKVVAGNLPAQTTPTKYYIIFGIGTQNYTCGADGAVAQLYDISCFYKSEPGRQLTDTYIGEHYFVTNPVTGTGISPKWDMTKALDDPNAFVIEARSAGIPAPTGPSDVDWLYLTNVQGALATDIYRTDTRGGQPPSSCTPGSEPIAVGYSTVYWLTGGFL